MTYTVKYTKTAYHLSGIETATTGTQMDYPVTACPSLSRGQSKMATGKSFDDLAEALKSMETSARVRGAKACAKCAASGARVLEA